jgi:hypothetical protein
MHDINHICSFKIFDICIFKYSCILKYSYFYIFAFLSIRICMCVYMYTILYSRVIVYKILPFLRQYIHTYSHTYIHTYTDDPVRFIIHASSDGNEWDAMGASSWSFEYVKWREIWLDESVHFNTSTVRGHVHTFDMSPPMLWRAARLLAFV